MSTAFYAHPDCRGHDMGPGHPECPQRLDAIEDHLLSTGLDIALQRPDVPLVRHEDLMLAQLEDDGHSLDEIDEALEATSGQLESLLHALPSHLASMAPRDLAGPLTGCRHLGLGERVEIGPTALAWLGQRPDPAAGLGSARSPERTIPRLPTPDDTAR